MSDSTSHIQGIKEAVCKELEVEDVPLTPVCNVHPLMMFDCKIKELCQKIHDCLGVKNLLNIFLLKLISIENPPR